MKTLVTVLFALSGITAAADQVPNSIAHVNVLNGKSGWMGEVVMTDTPETQGNLKVTFVQMQNDGTNKIFANDQLIAKEEDPSLSEIAKTYEANVSVQASTGSVVLSSYKDFGTSVWATDVIVSFRNGTFVISGIEYQYQYREQSGSCSLDFLTGHAIVNGKARKVTPQYLPLADATEASVIATCSRLMGL